MLLLNGKMETTLRSRRETVSALTSSSWKYLLGILWWSVPCDMAFKIICIYGFRCQFNSKNFSSGEFSQASWQEFCILFSFPRVLDGLFLIAPTYQFLIFDRDATQTKIPAVFKSKLPQAIWVQLLLITEKCLKSQEEFKWKDRGKCLIENLNS